MRLRLVLVIALLFYTNASAGRDIDCRIVLKHGQTAATIRGRIPSPQDSVVYEFSAHAGQRLLIRLEPDKDLVAQALLVSPSGKQDGPGVELSRTVDESGIFHIRVTPREQSSGHFRLYLGLR
jgi:hypothetical protein